MTHLEKMLQPDSQYVFYDDQHGFCINTDDVLMLFQSERKTGEWVNTYPDMESNPMLMYGICSECGYEQAISNKLNFCPNCGADMRENDFISRRDAIRWVKTECNPYGKPTLEFESGKKVIEHLEQMPSTRLEPLTDKEQRIFLAAMAREERICKRVDDECKDCKEVYEDSLVNICHEIIRKVKNTLWRI